MRTIAFDTETCRFRPGCMAPPLVCLTWQEEGGFACIEHHSKAEPILIGWLEDPVVRLVGHNVAYDLAVIAERYPRLRDMIFRAYEADRIADTMIRQQLLDISAGVFRGRPGEKGKWITHEYSLEALAKRQAGMILVKDAWRTSYGEFLNTPMEEWTSRAREVQEQARETAHRLRAELADCAAEEGKPLVKELAALDEMINGDPSRASEYPLDDARATLAVYLTQSKHEAWMVDQFRQTRAAWALHLSSAWGLRTDRQGVETLRAETQADYDGLLSELVMAGLVRSDGTRDTKAAKARMIRVHKEAGTAVRRTDAHAASDSKCKNDSGPLPAGSPECTEHVGLDSDACKSSGDYLLEDYAELSTLSKVLSNDVKALEQGVCYPVHTRYGLAETGRTTSSGPNIQNLRRKAGIREAFVPREGMVFASADYPQLELYTLAQFCLSTLKESKLADALNSGLDPHLAVAAKIVGISYENAKERLDDPKVDDARQVAKVANFGFPGGLGLKKLCLFARRTYGLDLSEDRAKLLKQQWYETWPEMPRYFSWVNSLIDETTGTAKVTALATGRIRGGASYCAACNNGFQALGADCAKEAAWQIARAQYTDKASALYNTRTVAFVHDEFIIEAARSRAHEAAYSLASTMVDAANMYLTGVPIVLSKVKPVLMNRWSKKAKPCFDAAGTLIPWVEK